MSGVAFIEGCPHVRGGLYEGSYMYYSKIPPIGHSKNRSGICLANLFIKQMRPNKRIKLAQIYSI